MSTDDKSYNGWKNRATWLVNIWFDSNWTEAAQEIWDDIARTAKLEDESDLDTAKDEWTGQLADRIKADVEEHIDEAIPTSSFIADLIDISEIDWRTLAEHYADDVDGMEVTAPEEEAE